MILTDTPHILVFAGPNGSGKSSVASAWQFVGPYINAEAIERLVNGGEYCGSSDICERGRKNRKGRS
jgi:predicted ABC-type ATPase